jgi:eukaryotic-like serine/threonine-protein kinase
MGEVYRARDTKLDREVAIKVLPEKLAEDPAALSRFEREAKAVAALSHPNILGVYDLGKDGNVAYAAMELLLGETLRERLAEGSLPLRKALEYGLQIVQGLAAAHEKGIVHRDLKPENVFITPEGRVKILDFGLAKVAARGEEGTKSPTVPASTEPGTVMGTVGYMSPEQVRGKAADQRSDIFSFGSLLYEMLSGRRAFQGDSAAETMAAIAQKDPPDLAEGSGTFSPAVERILRHCLEKRPEERFDTAHDLAFALETAIGGPSAPRVGAPEAERQGLPRPVLAASALLVALSAGLLIGHRLGAPAAPKFRQITYHRGFIQSARFAPDGQTVVYGSTRRDEPLKLFSTRLDSIESRALDVPPADVVGMAKNGEMAILMNRRHAGYWISVGTLARAHLGGGAPREILERVNDADITPDGKDFAVVREVGTRQRLEFPMGRTIFETSGWISHPRISPDGRRVAFLEHPRYGNDFGYVALSDEAGKVSRISDSWEGVQGLAWTPRAEEIWFTANDLSTASSMGNRSSLWAIRPGKRPRPIYEPPQDLWLADISSSGAVLLDAHAPRSEIGGRLAGDTKDRDLSTWSDEAAGGISDDGAVFSGIEQSAAGAGADPFVYYRRANDPAPVRIGAGTTGGISPDGRWVLTVTPEKSSVITLLPTGPGQPRVINLGVVQQDFSAHRTGSWSQDGRLLLIPGHEPGHLPRLWLVNLDSRAAPRAVTSEGSPKGALSPDGQAAVALDEKGRVLLCRMSGAECSEVKGVLPGESPEQWEASGKSIFVWDRTWPARIQRVDLATGERRLWKEITPPDPAGVLYGTVALTRDGEHYVYRVRRVTSRLYVAEGLK